MKHWWKILTIVMWVTAPALAQQPARVLSLSEATSLALERNPDLATIEQRLVAARAALRQAEASFYPHLRVGETYAASDNPVQAFMMTLNQRRLSLGPTTDFNDPPTTDNFNTRLSATYSLYDGGSTLADRQAARRGTEVAAYSLEAARNDLVFQTSHSFHTIGKARQLIRTAEAGVASMEANVRVAKGRFEEGNALKTDVLDAEVRLAEVREDLLRTRNSLAISEAIFRNVLGVGEDEPVTAADMESPGATFLDGLPSNGDADPRGAHLGENQEIQDSQKALDISKHPELLAAERAVAVAEHRLRSAKGGYLPHVNGFAGYDLDSDDLDRFSDSFVAGVSVELDVFDGFLTRGQVAAACADLAAAREKLRRAELAIRLDAKQAELRLAEAQARLRTTARAVEQAAESLQITKERYANGLALLAQLLDAETALTASRQRRATAAADLLIARAALNRALGRGWDE
jgi:outer membrane protein